MSAIDGTPVNKNFLSPLNFKFQIKRAPHINFFVQQVNIPGITVPELKNPNPMVQIPYPGEHVTYDSLSLTFAVDEDFNNYMEVHNWLIGLGKPKSFQQYADLSSGNPLLGQGVRSDISLVVLNSLKNPNYEVIFRDAFPISLSGLEFDTTENDISYMKATVEFTYILYTIEKIA
jgi:hypothetical protein